jgi:hypothetical protein
VPPAAVNIIATSEEQQSERLNCARNFFGDPRQRYDNRLRLERHSCIENYRSGNMALVLHCHSDVIGLAQSDASGFVREPDLVLVNRDTLVIFKADANEGGNLQHWDEQLMFVPNIKVVKGPDEWIPSRVGFYVIQNKVFNVERDLLLFQSAIQGGYKFLPSIAHWESGPLCRGSVTLQNHLVPQQVEGASEVVQHIANREGNVVGGKTRSEHIDAQMICSLPFVVLDTDGMKVVRLSEGANQRNHVAEVLFGPFNLQP